MILVAFSFLLVGFSLFAGLIPIGAGNYSEQRFLLCLVIWLTVCLCLAKTVAGRKHAAGIGWLPWLLPLILIFLSGELYPASYHVEPLMFAFFFLGCCLFSDHLSQSGSLWLQLGRVHTVIAFVALIYGFIALMNYALALRDGNTDIDTVLTWGFPNIRYWSHLATWLIPLIAAAQRSGSLSTLPTVRGLFVLAGSLWWWILFSTSARGSALGLLVGSIVVVVLFRRYSLDWLRSLGVQLLVGGSLWLVLTFLLPLWLFDSVDLRAISASSSGRIPLWIEAWNMSLVNFPFGLGPQSWLTHPLISDFQVSSKSFGHPHNMYLLWAAEYGWGVIVAFVIAFAGIGRSMVSRGAEYRAKGRDATIMGALTASFVAAFVHAGVSAVFMAPASMLTGFLVLTMFLALIQAPIQGGRSPMRVLARPSVRLSAGLALLVTLAVGPVWAHEVWRYYQDNLEDRLTYKGQGSIYSPRFWSHGDFPRQLNAD